KGSQKLRAASSYVGKQAITRHVQRGVTRRPQTLRGKAFDETRPEKNEATTGFLDTTHIPNNNTNERPPVTTIVFAATTPRNTLFAYRASTLTDPTTMINYDEEREMEPRHERTREVIPPLHARSPRVHRQRERVVGFEEAPNREGSRTGRNIKGRTSMQKIGIVVSTIHRAVKFHTTQGIRTVFSTHESNKIGEGIKKIRQTSPANIEGVLSYTDAEEKIIVNSKGITLKGQGDPPETTTGYKKVETEKVARSFEQPPRMLGSKRSRDMSKYCYFYEDHRHNTNDCRKQRS
nr:hypothetical protein [Tanacetum cinerariifolium]